MKLAAIDAVVKLEDDSSVPTIQALLTSENPDWVIEAAANALISLKGTAALASFEDALASPKSFSRIYAAGGILKLTQR